MDCDLVICLLTDTFVESLRKVFVRLVSLCRGSEEMLWVFSTLFYIDSAESTLDIVIEPCYFNFLCL